MNLPRPGDTKYVILQAIDIHWKTNPRGPTVAELRESVGLGGRSSVQFHINDLREMGLVESLPKRARTVRLTMRGKKLLKVMEDFGGDYPIGVERPTAPAPVVPSGSHGSPQG